MRNSKVDITDVAKLLNTTQLNVLMHIKRGLLRGSEEEGGWMIDQESLDAFLAMSGGVKSEDVCASGCAKKHACGGGCG